MKVFRCNAKQGFASQPWFFHFFVADVIRKVQEKQNELELNGRQTSGLCWKLY